MRHFFLPEPWDVRELYIRKTVDLPLQLFVGTFPRFCGYRILFSTRNPYINRFTNHFSIFNHNHLTLRKWCYTSLQHNFALDPEKIIAVRNQRIAEFQLHWSTFEKLFEDCRHIFYSYVNSLSIEAPLNVN